MFSDKYVKKQYKKKLYAESMAIKLSMSVKEFNEFFKVKSIGDIIYHEPKVKQTDSIK